MEQDNCEREDEADEALGEDVEGAGGGEEVAEECGGCWLRVLFGKPVGVEREGEPEADVGVGDGDAGEDEDARAGESYQTGVEAGSFRLKCLACKA